MITSIGVFKKVEFLTKNVSGVRIGDKSIDIESNQFPKERIIINNYGDLENSADLVNWLTINFKDLDIVDLKADKESLLNNPNLVLTEADRELKVSKATLLARIYNITAGIAAFVFFFFHYNKAANIVAVLFPLGGIVLMKLNEGIIKFTSNIKKSIYPNIATGFYLSALLLFISSIIYFNLMDYSNIFIVAVILSFIIGFLIYKTGFNQSANSITGQVFVIAILAFIYSYGATLQVNCLFDKSVPEKYKSIVLSKRISRGKSTSYYLTLGPWGAVTADKEVSVRQRLYREVSIRDTVNVYLKKGLLSIPWFMVSDK